MESKQEKIKPKVACSSSCGESACDCREEYFRRLQAEQLKASLILIPPQTLKVVRATDSSEHASIACGNQYIVRDIRIEHALRLVRCWNCHEDLLKACKALMMDISTLIQLIQNGHSIDDFNYDSASKALAAIAKTQS